MVAQLFGFIAAAVITSLIRTVGGDWMARRMLRTARREVAQMTQAAQAQAPASLALPSSPAFAASRDALLRISARMVDRIGLLMPRLAIAHPTPEARAVAVDGLRELRVGLHVAQLCAMCQQLEQAGVVLHPLLQKLGSYFGDGGHAHGQAPAALLERIDSTLRAVCASTAAPIGAGASAPSADEMRSQAAAALASMRRDLFPRAAAYQPEIAS
jgi:hypothetical protein